MSGNANFRAILPVTMDVNPSDAVGSKCVPVTLNWATVQSQNNGSGTSGFIATINLLSVYQTGQFGPVQAVYVDNGTNPQMCIITAADTGQVIRIPPFAKGMYPLLCGPQPTVTAQLIVNSDANYGLFYSNVTTRLYFLNTPQRYFESVPPNLGQNWGTYTQAFFLGASVTSQQLNAPGQNGTGMSNLGGNGQCFAITAIDLSLTVVSAYAANTAVTPAIWEQDSSGPYVTWTQRCLAAASGLGTIYSRQVVFPSPLIQRNPFNNYYFVCGTVPTAANSLLVDLNISYVILNVS